MNDVQLQILVTAVLKDGLAARGLPLVGVARAYQPLQQGASYPQGVYFHKLTDKRVGSPRREYAPATLPANMDATEVQQMETTFQVMALVKDETTYTAGDLVKTCAAIMQGDAGQAQLWAQRVGILRVTDLRNPFFTDDFGQFEASPSFDFVLTHKDAYASIAPAVEIITSGFHRV